jgi:prepilin-type N-terminal cleavage/methylation domain-containing protein
MRLRTKNGFTLIELMVTVAVLAIMAVLAVPSFIELRQRSAIQGAADQITTFWGDARFEALRRNVPVKVGFSTDAGGQFCMGATTTNPDADTACDCFTAGSCDVSSFPASQGEWRGVRVFAAPGTTTLGNDDADGIGVATIDPKRGVLKERADAGRVLLRGPSGPMDYRIDIVIDGNGRAFQCEPTAAPSKIPSYANRRC